MRCLTGTTNELAKTRPRRARRSGENNQPAGCLLELQTLYAPALRRPARARALSLVGRAAAVVVSVLNVGRAGRSGDARARARVGASVVGVGRQAQGAVMAKHGDVATGPGWELRCGAWQDVLADVKCDALISDPPYGARTHRGAGDMDRVAWKQASRRNLSYAHLTPQQVTNMVAHWAQRTRSWSCYMTCTDLIEPYRSAAANAGRYDFAPVPALCHRPRMVGDGPGSGAVYLMVSRPREKRFLGWGSLPCWYMYGKDPGGHIGGKPLPLMRAIVRDYSRPGDFVCDPYAGGGTTLLAAIIEGRRAIGAELDPVTFENAVERLRKGYTPDMFARQEQARVQLVPGELPF